MVFGYSIDFTVKVETSYNSHLLRSMREGSSSDSGMAASPNTTALYASQESTIMASAKAGVDSAVATAKPRNCHRLERFMSALGSGSLGSSVKTAANVTSQHQISLLSSTTISAMTYRLVNGAYLDNVPPRVQNRLYPNFR